MRRPLLGAILGIILGLAIAVVLQQHGIWPLDRLTVYLLPAVLGLVVLLIFTLGKEGGIVTLIIALIILIPMGVWGALGLGTANEQGVLNGGCEVVAESSVPDTTNVTDTSKQDPFEVDPNGSLVWAAMSPVAFDDYAWEIWVELGSNQVTIAEEENQDNDGGSQVNTGDVPNVQAYVEDTVGDLAGLRGVYKVGGMAAGTCDGFGFVKLISDPFETLASQIALIIIILILIIIIVIWVYQRRARAGAPTNGATNGDLGDGISDAGGGAEATAAAAGAAGAAAGAAAAGTDDDVDENFADDIAAGALASGHSVEDPVSGLSDEDWQEIGKAELESDTFQGQDIADDANVESPPKESGRHIAPPTEGESGGDVEN